MVTVLGLVRTAPVPAVFKSWVRRFTKGIITMILTIETRRNMKQNTDYHNKPATTAAAATTTAAAATAAPTTSKS